MPFASKKRSGPSFLMCSNHLLTWWFDVNIVEIPRDKVFGEPRDFGGTFRVYRFPESMRANYRVPLNPGTPQSPFTSCTISLSLVLVEGNLFARFLEYDLCVFPSKFTSIFYTHVSQENRSRSTGNRKQIGQGQWSASLKFMYWLTWPRAKSLTPLLTSPNLTPFRT